MRESKKLKSIHQSSLFFVKCWTVWKSERDVNFEKKKKEIFIKNKEKKTREMAANVKLFADRTMSASQKKKQQSKE